MAWTLDELVMIAGRVLERARLDPIDGRTVRYFTTLGIVDGPREFRGRKGLYGQRQLHQIVAARRLQREGLALADVQSRLYHKRDDALARIADVADAAVGAVAAAVSAAVGGGRAAGAFWETGPADDVAAAVGAAGAGDRAAGPVSARRVAPGCYVVVEGARRALDDDDAGALRELLIARGVLAATEGEGT